MKKTAFLFCMMALSCFSIGYAAHIDWKTDYQEALQQSSSTGKPVLLFFTGSDWCPYCIKLDREVMETDEFAQLVGNRFIFVMVDDPQNKSLPPDQYASVKRLQQKYDIQGLPAVIIIDSTERKLGSTGYKPGGPKPYAKSLLNMVGK